MHYTWGSIFKAANGTKVWEFDKRYYTEPKHEKEASGRPGRARAAGGRAAGVRTWQLAGCAPDPLAPAPPTQCSPRPNNLTPGRPLDSCPS